MKRFIISAIIAINCLSTFYCHTENSKHSVRTRSHTKKSRTRVPTKEEITFLEEKLIDLINIERGKHNLPSLQYWDVLADVARDHSQNMAEKKVAFGHDGFDDRAKSVRQKGKYRSFGENVAYCYNYEDPLKVLVDGWMDSPGHRDNILNDFNMTGIGIFVNNEGYYYATQLFAKLPNKERK